MLSRDHDAAFVNDPRELLFLRVWAIQTACDAYWSDWLIRYDEDEDENGKHALFQLAHPLANDIRLLADQAMKTKNYLAALKEISDLIKKNPQSLYPTPEFNNFFSRSRADDFFVKPVQSALKDPVPMMPLTLEAVENKQIQRWRTIAAVSAIVFLAASIIAMTGGAGLAFLIPVLPFIPAVTLTSGLAFLATFNPMMGGKPLHEPSALENRLNKARLKPLTASAEPVPEPAPEKISSSSKEIMREIPESKPGQLHDHEKEALKAQTRELSQILHASPKTLSVSEKTDEPEKTKKEPDQNEPGPHAP